MAGQAESWALIKQLFFETMSLLGDDFEGFKRLDNQQQEILRSKLWTMFNTSNLINRGANINVLDQQVELKTPSHVMDFVKEHYEPNFDALKNIYKQLDEVGYCLQFTLFDGLPSTRVKAFLENTLDNVYEDIDGTLTANGRFYKRYTDDLFKKRIYCFDPDDWFQRSEQLNAFKTSFNNPSKNIPLETVERINEAYSCYVHGHWFATQVLCRSILEAVIKDRASALHIDLKFSSSTKQKHLEQLIEEVTKKIPEQRLAMDIIRENGNQSIHPGNKIAGLPRQKESNALRSIEAIVPVCEAIYSAAR